MLSSVLLLLLLLLLFSSGMETNSPITQPQDRPVSAPERDWLARVNCPSGNTGGLLKTLAELGSSEKQTVRDCIGPRERHSAPSCGREPGLGTREDRTAFGSALPIQSRGSVNISPRSQWWDQGVCSITERCWERGRACASLVIKQKLK